MRWSQAHQKGYTIMHGSSNQASLSCRLGKESSSQHIFYYIFQHRARTFFCCCTCTNLKCFAYRCRWKFVKSWSYVRNPPQWIPTGSQNTGNAMMAFQNRKLAISVLWYDIRATISAFVFIRLVLWLCTSHTAAISCHIEFGGTSWLSLAPSSYLWT